MRTIVTICMLVMLGATSIALAQGAQVPQVIVVDPDRVNECKEQIQALADCIAKVQKTAKPTTTTRRTTRASQPPVVYLLQLPPAPVQPVPEVDSEVLRRLDALERVNTQPAPPVEVRVPAENPVFGEMLGELKRGNELRQEANRLIRSGNTWNKWNTIFNGVSAGANVGQLFKKTPRAPDVINNVSNGNTITNEGSSASSSSNSEASSSSSSDSSSASSGSISTPRPPRDDDPPKPPRPPKPPSPPKGDDKPRHDDDDYPPGGYTDH